MRSNSSNLLAPILIVAADQTGAIGRKGHLPWSIPAELRYFRHRTTGHALIMGRTTYDGLPRPLHTHERALVVVSSKPLLLSQSSQHEIYCVSTPEKALTLAHQIRPHLPPLVCGGARLYHSLLDQCSTLELSRIDQVTLDADTFLPPLHPSWSPTYLGPWQESSPRWRLEIWTKNSQTSLSS